MLNEKFYNDKSLFINVDINGVRYQGVSNKQAYCIYLRRLKLNKFHYLLYKLKTCT